MSLKSDLKSTLIVILLFCTLGLISFVLSPEQNQGPHGGTLKKSEGYFIEMRNFENILTAYLLNEKTRPVQAKDLSGEVKLLFQDNTDLIIPLQRSGEDEFKCKLPEGFISCKITFNVLGKPVSALFENTGQVVLKK